MKIRPLLAATGILTISALAQNVPPPPGTVHRVSPQPVSSQPAKSENTLTHFDLNFPGGTPTQFVDAVSKALGKRVNVVIPSEAADVKIMPIKLENVTVPDIFAAVSAASHRQVTISYDGSLNTTRYDCSFTFQCLATSSPIADESVWAFQSTFPTKEETSRPAVVKPVPPSVCRYFQLGSYLNDYTIEDITTAIQTGWKMLKVEPPPQLSFHKETKLLIAVGSDNSVDLIPQVLNQLARDTSPSVDKILRLQAEIADIKEEKQPGWEKLVEEKQDKIRQIAATQRARAEIDNTPPERRIIRSQPVNP